MDGNLPVVFKRMLSAFGVGGPSVDTVLVNPNTRPGLTLDGRVDLRGGDASADIEQVVLSLVTRVEAEVADSEYAGTMEFHRVPVTGAFQLAAGQEMSIPFQLPVPWETPITDVYGQRLHGMTMGLRTELAVARAVDKGDLDQVSVHPLPVHERILGAFTQLGCQFRTADLQYGRIHGVHQTLPFYQEIEFFAGPRYAHAVREIELTFVTAPHGVEVIIECDKRGGLFTAGHDVIGRFTVEHVNVDGVDWTQQVDSWLNQTVSRYQSHAGRHGGYHGSHGRSGMGGLVAGAAIGAVGGLVAGEILEDVFDGGDDGGFFGEE